MAQEAYEKAKPLFDAMFGYFQARQANATVDVQEQMAANAENALDDYVSKMIEEQAEPKNTDNNW